MSESRAEVLFRKVPFSGRRFLFVQTPLVLGLVILFQQPVGAKEESSSTIHTEISGLKLVFDRQTGGLLRMEYPGVGTIVAASPESAGLLDLAYPLPQFEPFRLAARFSSGARIQAQSDQVVVRWESLGGSRPFEVQGQISAFVRLRAAKDGRSILMDCEITNRSTLPVRQVLFPDFSGLVPFAGVEETEFRSGGLRMFPFQELRTSSLDRFYATNASFRVLKSGNLNDTEMIIRWMDLGSLEGGISLFPKRWGWDPHSRIFLHLSDKTHKLRFMSEHLITIDPGDHWSSGEFVLTPHLHGWAKGIEVYREWARKKMKRRYRVPDHIRDGLGFRSVWMCQNQPGDPRDAAWKFSDLPDLAKEAKAHGLEEMVMWIWHRPFTLPFPPPYPHLGTEQEMFDAIAECRKIGVNVSLFVSVLQAEKDTAARYGLAPKVGTGNWTYHTEFFPRFNPEYASGFRCVQVDTTDPRWQSDVLDSCRILIEKGARSLCWDQFWAVQEKPNLLTLTETIRDLAREKDPQSTFSGEELRNFEIDSEYLDYTWNWGPHEDLQPLLSVFKVPRINVNINTSTRRVKTGFADNLYLNVWPMKPDAPNGSDRIVRHTELSAALKQCARLRRRFLPYFTEGTFIGDCILVQPCREGHFSAYVLPESLLILFVNTGGKELVTAAVDFQPWLLPGPAGYRLQRYDEEGNPSGTEDLVSPRRTLRSSGLTPDEIRIFEIRRAG